MISGFEGAPAHGWAAAPTVWDELTSQFDWLVAQFTDRADLEAFAARLLHIPLPAHAPLITRDAASCSLYLVVRGALSVTVVPGARPERDDGRASAPEPAPSGALTLGHIGPGGWIGESGLMNLEPVGYSVTVARESSLLVLTASQFARLRRERARAASTLLEAFSLQIAERFRAYRRRLADAAAAGARPLGHAGRGAGLALLAVLLGISGT